MNLRTLTLIAATLVGSALCAQEGPRFGLQAGLNLPQSDLKDAVDDKAGFNIGAQVTFDLRGGHMLRPRLDYTWFPEHRVSDLGASAEVKFSSLSVVGQFEILFGHRPLAAPSPGVA